MSKPIIVDSMKKEGRWQLVGAIFWVTCAVLPFLLAILTGKEIIGSVIIASAFFLIAGCFPFFTWLYRANYRIEVTEQKIYIKTLFKEIEINIWDITSYTYLKNKDQELCAFILYYKNTNQVIKTRFGNELGVILRENSQDKSGGKTFII